MKEDILQYIWQFQYFNGIELHTTAGDVLQVIHPGTQNFDQGPDFTNAKIKIAGTLWVGNVEIHVKASDWYSHHHSADSNYQNIILHVVWNNNRTVDNEGRNYFPTVELHDRVSKILLNKYRELMTASQFIPCEKQVQHVNELVLSSWKQRLLAERLLAKSEKILLILKETNDHWEETFWRLIAANFGLTVNRNFFELLARSVPITLLAKHKKSIHHLEALLLGQAGLLKAPFKEQYPAMLQKEFHFYQKKYQLQPVSGEAFFLRMRPANFPTIRLAQLASLLHESEHLFSRIKSAALVKDVAQMLQVTANDYWNYHYVFDEESPYRKKTLGRQMVYNIIINTIVPVIFSYGVYHDETIYKEKAVAWLEEIFPEKNKITKGFQTLGFSNKNAFDSQALIQLKNKYCNHKLCLHCAIGNAILKKG